MRKVWPSVVAFSLLMMGVAFADETEPSAVTGWWSDALGNMGGDWVSGIAIGFVSLAGIVGGLWIIGIVMALATEIIDPNHKFWTN